MHYEDQEILLKVSGVSKREPSWFFKWLQPVGVCDWWILKITTYNEMDLKLNILSIGHYLDIFCI